MRRHHASWSCELRDYAKGGVEAQILRNGELVIGRRFGTKALAVEWAEMQQTAGDTLLPVVLPNVLRPQLRVASSTAHANSVSREQTLQHPGNRILSALPSREFDRIAPHLLETVLPFKHVLAKPGQPITQICFPDTGVCSVMSATGRGATMEVGTVGNEGLTGVALFFGVASDLGESMVQVPGTGRLLPAEIFQVELDRKDTLHRLVGEYAHALMMQVMQSAACNARHSVEERGCKWLLMTHDRVSQPEFVLTREFLGLMLGVNRPTVNAITERLERARLVRFRHGRVSVLDRKGLEKRSCECYAIITNYFDEFLERLSSHAV